MGTFLTGLDMNAQGPLQFVHKYVDYTRIIHVVRGAGVMTFPATEQTFTFTAGDVFLAHPGYRTLTFRTGPVRYRYRCCSGFPEGQSSASQLRFRDTHRQLVLAAMTEMLICSESRADVLADLLSDIVGEQLQEGTRPPKRLLELFARVESDPLRYTSVQTMARELGVSTGQVRRLFVQWKGVSPQTFLIDRRFWYARQLLHDTGLPIGEIADMLGYSDTFAFSKQYKRQFGSAPSYDRAS